jgi:hypothetical protein
VLGRLEDETTWAVDAPAIPQRAPTSRPNDRESRTAVTGQGLLTSRCRGDGRDDSLEGRVATGQPVGHRAGDLGL